MFLYSLACRLHLNKQIQQLEKYIHRSDRDEERRISHNMTSTTARGSQLGTPATILGIDSLRFSSQVHINNELGHGGGWSTPMPFSSTDRLNSPLPPVERELFAPKVLDINYTEGSANEKWKRLDFPWTKKLEVSSITERSVIGFCYFVFFTYAYSLVHFITIPGQQQESVWKSFLPSQSEGGDQCNNEWMRCFCFNANWWWKEPNIPGICICMKLYIILK